MLQSQILCENMFLIQKKNVIAKSREGTRVPESKYNKNPDQLIQISKTTFDTCSWWKHVHCMETSLISFIVAYRVNRKSLKPQNGVCYLPIWTLCLRYIYWRPPCELMWSACTEAFRTATPSTPRDPRQCSPEEPSHIWNEYDKIENTWFQSSIREVDITK